ncbi:MAG: hypothetical protein D6713_08150, partial [Deltaproteobacteria bacterium]
MKYSCVKIEGGLLSPDFLERITEVNGQSPESFGFDRKRSFVGELSSRWADVRSYWEAFQRRRERGKESLTTITRESWVIPLLELLDYRLTFQRAASVIKGRTYPISHRAVDGEVSDDELEKWPPVHIVSFDQDLGERPSSGRGNLSPHALLQDYLNKTDHVWGIVTNGRVLRLLRDSSFFTRPSYIEFNLEEMVREDRFDEFIIFFRLVHRSRLPSPGEEATCLLEKYYETTVAEGGRIRDGLRDAVEKAIKILGTGFLSHPENRDLRKKVEEGALTPTGFYRELLILIYRILFLTVAEERHLLFSPREKSDKFRILYERWFSLSKLRRLSENPPPASERFSDLYLGLKTLFVILGREDLASSLKLPPLNGELFRPGLFIDEALLSNRDLLYAISQLSFFTPPGERVRRRVNYAYLDVEELGSVYESLLDYHPVIRRNGEGWVFDFVEGSERKSTGSYYTPPPLVGELINSALMPVVKDR